MTAPQSAIHHESLRLRAAFDPPKQVSHGSHFSVFEADELVAQKSEDHAENIISRLQGAWGWIHGYMESEPNVPQVVSFKRHFSLSSVPSSPTLIHLTADTRYKLFVNGHRASIGPARGSDRIWFYDTVDIRPFLIEGDNQMLVRVVRYPYAFDGAFTHARTVKPGFALNGKVQDQDISTNEGGWQCRADKNIRLLQRLPYDTNLHNFETVEVPDEMQSKGWSKFHLYILKTGFGILSPWRLAPRMIPLPECTTIPGPRIRFVDSVVPEAWWGSFFSRNEPIKLPPRTFHRLELEFVCHSTAYIKVIAQKLQASNTDSRLKITYSEAYEAVERRAGNLASKGVRDQREGHCLRGPHDEFKFGGGAAQFGQSEVEVYEPFWWRAFRFIVFEVDVGDTDQDGLTLLGFEATQTNYPLNIKAKWELGTGDVGEENAKLWDISVRTLRNCAFDGYSDCPFYEQLQYCQDTRSSALFHYCISGDDRLAKQAIHAFASSMLPGGLVQARYPAQFSQVITGFSLFWVLQVCDNLWYFNDKPFARRYLPEVDAVLDFFERHIGPHGLVEGLPREQWLFVDWVTSWDTGEQGTDPGVPVVGRENGIFTFFSMLYAYVLAEAAKVADICGRPGLAQDYSRRREPLIEAIRKYCFDGRFFTDSLASVRDHDMHVYSQHCQIWGILCVIPVGGAEEERRILMEAFYPNDVSPASSSLCFSDCSYPMWFYAYRAFSKVGMYNEIFDRSLQPWRKMLDNHMTTWEEDSVTRRSDCHAWSSTYLFEAMTEIAGLKPLSPGWKIIAFSPRVALSPRLRSKFPLGDDQVAEVEWSLGDDGSKVVELKYKWLLMSEWSCPMAVSGRSFR